MNMELGTAKRAITPPRPVRLAGYATRTTPFDSVLEDIYVRVHDYRCGSDRAVLVYGDLLWWNSEFVAMARPRLAAALGVKEEQILFTASHNHSGPGTGGNFTPLLETVDAAVSYTHLTMFSNESVPGMRASGPYKNFP